MAFPLLYPHLLPPLATLPFSPLPLPPQAHSLKNKDSQICQSVANLPTKRRLLLSGTPVQVGGGMHRGLQEVQGAEGQAYKQGKGVAQ